MLVLTFFVVLVPTGSQAQANISINSLEVELWPEYDRPEMLVIYKVELSPEVSLPAEITLRIPSRAGEPNAVAERQANGALFTMPYERQVQGEWAILTYTATMPEAQIEYYDPDLEREGNRRRFEYLWPGDYPVGNLAMEVQQPADADGMEISPGLGAGAARSDGLVYYAAPVGPMALGQNYRVTVAYTKDSDALSVELQGLPLQPSAPITAETPGRVSLSDMLPWALGLLGLVLIGSGVWWYRQIGRVKAQPVARRRRRAMPPEVADVPDEGSVYCHQCGKRAGPGDHFCRACGTRLRV